MKKNRSRGANGVSREFILALALSIASAAPSFAAEKSDKAIKAAAVGAAGGILLGAAPGMGLMEKGFNAGTAAAKGIYNAQTAAAITLEDMIMAKPEVQKLIKEVAPLRQARDHYEVAQYLYREATFHERASRARELKASETNYLELLKPLGPKEKKLDALKASIRETAEAVSKGKPGKLKYAEYLTRAERAEFAKMLKEVQGIQGRLSRQAARGEVVERAGKYLSAGGLAVSFGSIGYLLYEMHEDSGAARKATNY